MNLNTQPTATAAELRPAKLIDRVAIVVGGARGIGAAIGKRLYEEGARVILGDTNIELARETAAATGPEDRVMAVEVDISQPDAAGAIVDTAMETFGRLDILVQNAAIYPWTLIKDITAEEWDAVLGVNLRSAFLTARAAHEPMAAAGGGRLIFISSITGPRVSSPGHAHYAASKAGINGFVRTAAIEYLVERHNGECRRTRQYPDRGSDIGAHPGIHRRHVCRRPARPAGQPRGRRQRRRLPRLGRGELYHGDVYYRGRRPDASGIEGFQGLGARRTSLRRFPHP